MRITRYLLAAAMLLLISTNGYAEVEWQISRNLQLPAAPVDVTTSADGQKIFVLLDKGEVRIYDADGRQYDSIRLGPDADRIAVSPDGQLLLVSDSRGKQIKMVSLDFIKSIDIAGSPFRGPEEAKVVVAVYSDFQ